MNSNNNSAENEFNAPINKIPIVQMGADGKFRIKKKDAIAFDKSLEGKKLKTSLCQYPFTLTSGMQCQNKPQTVVIAGKKIEGFCKIHALKHHRETLKELYTEISPKEAKAVMAKRMKENPMGTIQDKLHTKGASFTKPNKAWANKKNIGKYDVMGYDTEPTSKKDKDKLQKEYMAKVRASKKGTKVKGKSVKGKGKTVKGKVVKDKSVKEEGNLVKYFGVSFTTDLQKKLIGKLKKKHKKNKKSIEKEVKALSKKNSSERTRLLKLIDKKYK